MTYDGWVQQRRERLDLPITTLLLVEAVHERYVSRQAPPTISELAEALGKTRTTARRHVARALDLQLLEHRGAGTRSLFVTHRGLDELDESGLRCDDEEVGWAKPDEADRWQAEFGRRLRSARKTAGLTISAVGDRANLSMNYISQVERGKRNIALVNILILAHSVGVAPGELLDGIL
jgi:DNA-binding XRE family transcriptional regulator